MPHPKYTTEEIARRGQALYDQQIAEQLDANLHGKFLVVDIETGEYEIDVDSLAASKRARMKHPNAALYLMRIGYAVPYRLGSRKLSV